jgi:hypothetical protein
MFKTYLESNLHRISIKKPMSRHSSVVSSSAWKGLSRMQALVYCIRYLILALVFVPYIMGLCMKGGILGNVVWFENSSMCFELCLIMWF